MTKLFPALFDGSSPSQIGLIISGDYNRSSSSKSGKYSVSGIDLKFSWNGLVPWIVYDERVYQDEGILARRPSSVWRYTLWTDPFESDVSREYCFTGSRAHLSLARRWLDTCSGTHKCCQTASDSFRPTRLVYTGVGPKAPFLSEEHANTRNIRYCALTHCWGGAEDILKLTHANHKRLKKEIAMQALPRTFRDAILISRGLGIDYVWIDSLCIIQNSRSDWKKEARSMGRVYECSTVTIAAAKARNAHDGCFAIVNPLLTNACIVAGSEERGLSFPSSYSPDEIQFGDTTIGRRGWTLQERFLSHRTVFFGPSGIAWRCEVGEANEKYSHGFNWPKEANSDGSNPSKDTLSVPALTTWSTTTTTRSTALSIEAGRPAFRRVLRADSCSAPHDEGFLKAFHNCWATIVHEYSECELTYSNDKLVAIAGLVDRIQTRTGLTYTMGMWEEILLESLCWFVSASSAGRRASERKLAGLRPRPVAYRAPSWSWASKDATICSFVEWGRRTSWEPLASILSAPGSTCGNNVQDFTESGSYLELLTKIEWVDVDFDDHVGNHECNGIRGDCTTVHRRGFRLTMDCVVDEHCTAVYLAPLMFQNFMSPAQTDSVPQPRVGLIVGIALVPKPGESECSTYERVGAFAFDGGDTEGGCMAWYEDLTDRKIRIM